MAEIDARNSSYLLSVFARNVESNPMLSEIRKTPEFKALAALIVYPDAYREILDNYHDFAPYELSLLIEIMASGWARAVLMQALERKNVENSFDT